MDPNPGVRTSFFSALLKFLFVFCCGFILSATIMYSLFIDHNSKTKDMGSITFSVIADDSANLTVIPAEKLAPHCDYSIAFYNVQQVTVNVAGQSYDLIDAIQNGIIDIEEIIAQVKMDSKTPDFCREKFTSELGCSTFIYRYNDFEIKYRYDVFECSDGQMQLLKDLIIAPYGQSQDVTLGFEKDAFNSLLYEDWGLTFSANSISPNGITVIYEQNGGQQANKLYAEGYWIGDNDGNIVIPLISLENKIELLLDGKSTFNIDFPSETPSLSPGSYIFCLHVSEAYTPIDVHPLQKNYCNDQFFTIEFVIE